MLVNAAKASAIWAFVLAATAMILNESQLDVR
ncbi:hypothetical protein A2U01_0107169, partial [Trifolium medium]|nr:hypothetical protein [Trifolium medium]